MGRVLQGKYKIVKLLGEGGMGAVYVGEQMLGERVRRVAIKTLHAHLSRDEKIRARFHREVGTLAGLEHPNTVQVFDFGQTEDGLLFLVMEFVQGRSIADILEKDGALAPARVEKIIRQIGGSLAEAHAQGIIHRDLKPDNVVLTERAGTKDFVKVLDFGIAKRSGEEDQNEPKLTQQGMVLGTPPYMSPEQFTGQPLDARSDIYSLGVMAYEMLTNTLPFVAETAYEWATLHMTAAPKPIEAAPNGAALPESMRGAIMKALAKSPDQRFATVTEFVERFGGHVAPSHAELAQRAATRGAMIPGTNAAMPVPSAFSPGPQTNAAPPAKGKTQIGEPLDFGTFSPSPADAYAAGAANGYVGGTQAGMAMPPAMAPGGYGPPPQGYGPPPQAYAPQMQAGPERESGSRKGLVIGLLAVVGVGSVIALLAGFGVFSSSGTPPAPTPDLGSIGTTAPTATPTSTVGEAPTSTPTSTPPLTTSTPTPLPTVKPTPTAPKPTATPTTPPPQPTPTTPAPTYVPPAPTYVPPAPTYVPPAPTPVPTPPPQPTPVPTPVPVPTQPRPTPGGVEPASCRTLHSGRNFPAATRSALEAACRREGGTP